MTRPESGIVDFDRWNLPPAQPAAHLGHQLYQPAEAIMKRLALGLSPVSGITVTFLGWRWPRRPAGLVSALSLGATHAWDFTWSFTKIL
jgi:hypothetical protein